MKEPTLKIKPFSDNVVAVREKAKEKSSGGLFLPDAVRRQTVYATVIAVGAKVSEIKVDDKILYKDYCSTDVKIDDVEYLIIKEEDVIAAVGGGES